MLGDKERERKKGEEEEEETERKIESRVETFRNAHLLAIKNLFFALAKVLLTDLHSTFTKSHQTGLSAESLNIGSREFVFTHHKLLDVDVFGERHFARVNLKDFTLCLCVWKSEFDLSVDTSGSDESWIKTFDSVCCHQYFDLSSCVESVELIQQLEHRSLDLSFSS